MDWTEEQRVILTREYRRIGYTPGDRWPAPPDSLTPADLLKLFERIPDGAGRDGYVVELGKYAMG